MTAPKEHYVNHCCEVTGATNHTPFRVVQDPSLVALCRLSYRDDFAADNHQVSVILCLVDTSLEAKLIRSGQWGHRHFTRRGLLHLHVLAVRENTGCVRLQDFGVLPCENIDPRLILLP